MIFVIAGVHKTLRRRWFISSSIHDDHISESGPADPRISAFTTRNVRIRKRERTRYGRSRTSAEEFRAMASTSLRLSRYSSSAVCGYVARYWAPIVAPSVAKPCSPMRPSATYSPLTRILSIILQCRPEISVSGAHSPNKKATFSSSIHTSSLRLPFRLQSLFYLHQRSCPFLIQLR